ARPPLTPRWRSLRSDMPDSRRSPPRPLPEAAFRKRLYFEEGASNDRCSRLEAERDPPEHLGIRVEAADRWASRGGQIPERSLDRRRVVDGVRPGAFEDSLRRTAAELCDVRRMPLEPRPLLDRRQTLRGHERGEACADAIEQQLGRRGLRARLGD